MDVRAQYKHLLKFYALQCTTSALFPSFLSPFPLSSPLSLFPLPFLSFLFPFPLSSPLSLLFTRTRCNGRQMCRTKTRRRERSFQPCWTVARCVACTVRMNPPPLSPCPHHPASSLTLLSPSPQTPSLDGFVAAFDTLPLSPGLCYGDVVRRVLAEESFWAREPLTCLLEAHLCPPRYTHTPLSPLTSIHPSFSPTTVYMERY